MLDEKARILFDSLASEGRTARAIREILEAAGHAVDMTDVDIVKELLDVREDGFSEQQGVGQ